MKTRTKKLTRRNVAPWYSIEDKEDRAEVFIFDEIGFFGISAQTFVRDLSEIKAKHIDLRLNTPGGNVFEGMAIFNALKAHPATIATHVDGLAASIGSVIALAGDTVNIAKNAFMMIHESWTIVLGSASELRKEAEVLDKIDKTIADVYADFTGEDLATFQSLMANETWFDAEEAKALGLATHIVGDTEAENRFDLSVFNHVPDALKKYQDMKQKEFTEREIEQILRDAGMPKSKSAAIAAGSCNRKGRREAGKENKKALSIIKDIQTSLRS